MRQFRILSITTCEYGLQDVDTIVIYCVFDFWKERRSIIDYPIYPEDDHNWFTTEFREWRATRDLCFIIDLLVLDHLDPCLLIDILRDYTLEFEVRVESTLRDLIKCLTEVIKDRDCYKEILDATMEDFNEMG